MALISIERAARNEDFRSRVQAAMVFTSMDIVDKANNDDDRSYMASNIIANPGAGVGLTTFLWLTAALLAETIDEVGKVYASDAEVMDAVRQVWDKYQTGHGGGGVVYV